MSDYNEMWKGLGLDMERHDQLLNALGAIYSEGRGDATLFLTFF